MAAIKLIENWQYNKSMQESMFFMLENDILTDVTFIVGEHKIRISAHKLVLASRSPVFYAMLQGPLAEADDITIPDIAEAIFREMLRYIYTDNLVIEEESIDDLIYMADKYDLKHVLMECENFLLHKTTAEDGSSWKYIEQGIKYNMERLKKKAVRDTCTALRENTSSLPEQFFTSSSKEIFQLIIDSEFLSFKELDIYRLAVKWAQSFCVRHGITVCDQTIRDALGPIIYSIRFPLMTSSEFCNVVSIKNVLTRDDKISIFQYTRSDSKRKQRICKFQPHPRLSQKPENWHPSIEDILKKFNSIHKVWPSLGE